jgi:hypothetical protein
MQLLRRPDFQDGETCQGESVSASLTDLALILQVFPIDMAHGATGVV